MPTKRKQEEIKKRETAPRRAKKEAEEKQAEIKEKKKPAPKKPKKEKVTPPEIPARPLAPQVDVIIWGSGETGQLGMGNDVLEKKKPALIPTLKEKNVLKLAVGGMHTAILVQDPEKPANTSLWTWGCNDQKILGRETPTSADEDDEDLSMVPGLVSALEGKNIVDVSTGDYHMLALDNVGNVYAWGTYKDADKFLGINPNQRGEQEVPVLFAGLAGFKVTQIASAYNHSIVLTDKGEVFQWGFSWMGRRVSDRHHRSYLTPTRVMFPRVAGKQPKIKTIAAGGYHSFAIAEDGKVFSWGMNNMGQLGDGTEVARSEPAEIVALRDKKIISVGGGQHFSLALSETGTVYSWGRNSYGQLGHGENDTNVPTPTAIDDFVEDDDDKVVAIACADAHSFALTEQGAAYVWGFNENNQCTGEEKTVYEPTRVPFNKYRIIAAGGGGQHSTILGAKKEEPKKEEPKKEEAKKEETKKDD